MEHSNVMSKSVILILLGIMCHHRALALEGSDFGEDQIAMESASSFASFPQYRSYLPPPSGFEPNINPSDDDSEDIEDLPSPSKWKSSSELRKSTSRTFKDGKPVVLIDKKTGLPIDPEEKKKYLANPEEHQARNSYSYVNTNTGTLLFGTGTPYYYLNFTDSQQNTFAALGNAALFLGSLLVLGNLPASTLGFNKKSDDQFDHRTGAPLGRPPHDVLVPPPRLAVPSPPNPFNALHEGIRSYQRGVSRLVGKNKRRPSNKRQGSFVPKRTKHLLLPNLVPSRQSLQLLNPVAGVRRLRKKVGNALKEYTFRKRGSGRNNQYRGDRRGQQNIESSNTRPSRHPHHRNYPLPLPPMSDVVTNSMRKRNRYNRNKQPVYFDDMPEYGNGIYQTGVVLEPIRPPVDDPVYYDEEEYLFEDYNDIPLTPPTPAPTQRQKPRARLSDTFRNNYRKDVMYDEQPQLSYPSRNRGSRYPLALGSTATTTTHRPYDDINEISSEGFPSSDSLDLNISPYMSAPQHTRQPEYNPYPTLSNNSPSSSISSTLAASSENDLLSEGDNGGIKVSNKKRKRTRSRVKRKRRPNQKKAVINKEIPVRSSYVEPTQDPLEALEKLRKERVSSQNNHGSFLPSYNERDHSNTYNERDHSNNNGHIQGPTSFNNPFGSNSFPTPTASWTQLSPGSDDRRYSGDDGYNKIGSSQESTGHPFFEPQGFDPFEQMSKDFDGGNDEWISTISKAFEGFSDFKKIDGGQETDLK